MIMIALDTSNFNVYMVKDVNLVCEGVHDNIFLLLYYASPSSASVSMENTMCSLFLDLHIFQW